MIQRRKFRGSDAYDEKGKEDNGQMRTQRGKHQFKGVYIKTRCVCVCVHRQAYITSGYLDLQLCLLVLLMFSSNTSVVYFQRSHFSKPKCVQRYL